MAKIEHYCASNDVNGNPQRVFVLVNPDGDQVAAWDEGYLGSDAVPGIWRRAADNADRINVSIRDYRRLLKILPSPAWASEVPGYAHLTSQGS